MKKDLALRPLDFTSSFLSCEKDLQTILRKLFVESQPYSDDLKRLLVINTKDCLDNKNNEVYQKTIQTMSLAKLRSEGYILFEPKVMLSEHSEVKSYLFISFDNFKPTDTNPQFRDCTVFIDILCHSSNWDLGNFRVRPLKICGYIDGILNNARLSGIGTFQFLSCKQFVLDETFSGYTMCYAAVHGTDDRIPTQHGWIPLNNNNDD